MKYQLHKKEDFQVSRWMGGETCEIAIWPASANYLERNFIWRLSSATVELDESDFSRLEDYDRVLMVLEGEVVLSHEGQRVARLAELEQDRFDGAYKTRSFGKITDYNLMVRKGNEGYLDLLYPVETAAVCGSTFETAKPCAAHTLYCHEGYVVVGCGGQSVMVPQGQQLVMHFDLEAGEKPEYTIMGEGTVIRGQIYFDEMKGQLAAEDIPAEKATFDDFKACMYLANVQFRLAKYIVPSLKKYWFDEALTSVIRKLEKIYLTYIVFLAGAMTVCGMVIKSGMSSGMVFAGLGAWLVIDCLLVSPLIYFIFLPKPVRKHIKDVNHLTPYEQKLYDAEQAFNPEVEKMLKKYKNSGRNFPQ